MYRPQSRADVIYASAARTTHTTSQDQYLNGYRGFRVDIDITAFSGTSITFTTQYYDPAKGDWLTLLASAALSATGHTTLTVSPFIATSANVSLQAIPPYRWRIVPSGTITSVTYSVSCQYLS